MKAKSPQSRSTPPPASVAFLCRRGIFVFFLTALARCILIAPNNTSAGTIEGVIFSEAGPVKNASVLAYRSYDDLVSGHNFIRSTPESRDGQYSINLQSGTYYLTASAELDGVKLFSYHGVNPISVSDDYRWLPFFLVPENRATCSVTSGQTVISGNVYYKKQPVPEGVVSIYPRQDGKFRGMGLLTNSLDETGAFSFNLDSGSYVIVARKKQAAKGIGPIKQGDLFCYPSANPIILSANTSCAVDVNCYPRDDLNIFLDPDAINPQGRRHDARRQSSLHELEIATTGTPSNTTVISGKVTDANGKPLPGLTVTAYPSRGVELFQMHILRLITNNMARTDANGGYKIELTDKDKIYYIVAREKVGGAPERLEYFGLYEGSPNHSVDMSAGTALDGINIVASQIMPNYNKNATLESK